MIIKCIANTLEHLPEALQQYAFTQDETGKLDITVGKHYVVYGKDLRGDTWFFLVHTDTGHKESFWWMPSLLYEVVSVTEPNGWQEVAENLYSYPSLGTWQVSEGLEDGDQDAIATFNAEVGAENKQAEHEAFLLNLPNDIRDAASHIDNNREELSSSKLAGCYYCLSIFSPDLIWEWTQTSNDGEFPMCPYCGIDSVYGDASGYPVTKEFLCEMNKHWFGGDGELISSQVSPVLARYEGKILGVRNYDATQQTFVTTDFINLSLLYDFIWEVATGESDFTPAGIAFLHEYFDLTLLANELSQLHKKLPPQGEGRTRKKRIELFVEYIKRIEPLEVTLFIASSQWKESGMKDDEPSLRNLDEKLLPPK